MTNWRFSVDTHLLRELGELLVGRESTAILELIKNAYDADAATVVLDASGLEGNDGRIDVVDDGHGMTEERFRTAFLRIAGRDKEGGDRRSPDFLRRYTGEKGIGRLATHKLAAALTIISIPAEGGAAVEATIDWDQIEEQDSLDDLKYGLSVRPFVPRQGQPTGTTFTLTRLRRQHWTSRQRALFVQEVASTQPPKVLLDPHWPPQGRVAPSLLGAPDWRDAGSNDPGFEVKLAGDFDTGDDLWDQFSERFSWCVEIDGLADAVEYQITPLGSLRDEPAAQTYNFRRTVPLATRPAFQARFFITARTTGRGPLGGFVRANGGIRVYLEGFRVLPYGEQGNDWLSIGRDYRGGARRFRIALDEDSDRIGDDEGADPREALTALSNESYFGAVFLTERGTQGLQTLVNREGFVPDENFEALVELVRTGVNLSVRVRRAVQRAREEREAREQVQEERARRRTADSSRNDVANEDTQESRRWTTDGDDGNDVASPGDELPGAETTEGEDSDIIQAARAAAERARSSPVESYSAETVDLLVSGLTVADAELQLLRSAQADLRVLAGVGLQLGAFVHDINGMLGQAATVRELLTTMLSDHDLTTRQRTRLRQIERAVVELTHTLARQSSYLTDVLVADPRRRRSRVRVAERIGPIERLLAGQLARRQVDLRFDLPADLRTPPMFPAEISVLLTNLLTNAVKNAGTPGVVLLEGRQLGGGGVTLLVHNTGVAVDLSDAERWFRPFESTTTEIDEILGQGLGLGLPISRALVEDYRGSIEFSQPPPGFATTVRVDLPDPMQRGR